ncbi:MAG: phosphatidylserine/phosphatidylglycerophosphate/cardiolipin synthase family protein [bacterium]
MMIYNRLDTNTPENTAGTVPWSRALCISAVAMFVLAACGDFKKFTAVDSNKQSNKPNNARPMTPEEIAEAREVNRLYSLYNPWQLPAKELEQDGLGTWRRSDVAFVRPGYESLKARMTLLDNATRSVRIQTFIFDGDETGQAFANKLIDLADRGIDVQLVVDDTSGLFEGWQTLYYYLTSHGVKVNGYRPVWMQIGNNPNVFVNMFFGNTLQERFGDALTIAKIENHRFHEKIMVVDAEIPGYAIAMVGGTNLGNEYYDIMNKTGELKWRDQDMLVRGDVVTDLALAFDSNVLDINAVNSQAFFSDTIEKLVSGQRGSFGKDQAKGVERRPYPMQQFNEALASKPNLRWHTANIRQIHHRPLHNEFKAEKRLANAIMHAQREVIIVNPYVIPSEELMNAIITSARRGISIKILTNSLASGDTPTVQEVGRTYYKTMILETQPSKQWPYSVPVSIYEWGGDTVFKNGFSNFHAKYVLVDRQMAYLGSFNLDPRSAVWNSEVLYETDAPLLVAQLLEQQAHDSGPGYASLVTKEMAESYRTTKTTYDTLRRNALLLFKGFL